MGFVWVIPCLVSPIWAQAAENSQSPAVETARNEVLEEIRVVGNRRRFGVEGQFEPQAVYNPGDIQALGVSSLSEIMEELAPELESSRGRQVGPPVVLLNGQRISGFREIYNYPSEAIERVETYSEEVALQYGFRADQKVINFVLRENFQATTVQVSAGGSLEGGAESTQAKIGHLKLSHPSRVFVDLSNSTTQPLHDSDRSVAIQQQPFSELGNVIATTTEIDPLLSSLFGSPVDAATLPADVGQLAPQDLLVSANNPDNFDERSLRTLIAKQDRQFINANFAFPINQQINSSYSLDYSDNKSVQELGAANLSYLISSDHPSSPFAETVTIHRGYNLPLIREQTNSDLELNATFNGTLPNLLSPWLNGWHFTWLNQYQEISRDVTTDRSIDAVDYVSQVAQGEPTTNPFTGPQSFSLISDRDSTDNRQWSSQLLLRGILRDTDVGSWRGSANLNFTSINRDSKTRSLEQNLKVKLKREVQELRLNLDIPLLDSDQVGRLSLSGNIEAADYSDFGGITIFGTNLTWRPNQALRITSSYTIEEGAPSIEQLGAPITRNPNRRIFDFVQGATSNVTVITGGNPDLVADKRRIVSISAQLEPFDTHNLSFSADFTHTEVDNPILNFPTANADVEAIFPERFERDPTGNLVSFDARPINFDQEKRQELRFAIRYSKRISNKSKKNSQAKTSLGTKQKPQLKPQQRRRGGRGSRLSISLNHTLTLKDELTGAAPLGTIDFLGVNSAGRPRGGAEHEVTLRGGYSSSGRALRFNLVWRSATQSSPGSLGELHHDSLLTTRLALVQNFHPQSALVQRLPFLSGTRVKLTINNIFNEKPNVRNQAGQTPIGLSGDELDPQGRALFLQMRKLIR